MLALAVAAALIAPRRAGAQRSAGTIAVAATILPAPLAAPASQVTLSLDEAGTTRVSIRQSAGQGHAATFVRVAVPGRVGAERLFIAMPVDRERTMTIPLHAASRSTPVRMERLIIAGT